MCLVKCNGLSESVAFAKKLRYLTDQNGIKARKNENEYWLFWNIKIDAGHWIF